MTQLIHLDGNSLTLEEVIAVARHGAQCELDEQAKEAVIASRKIVDDIVREKRVVYECNHLALVPSVMSASLQKIQFNCKKT
ncbi:MAG: aromatic amino acid lyase [Streptococcus sp.]